MEKIKKQTSIQFTKDKFIVFEISGRLSLNAPIKAANQNNDPEIIP
jgi:hypothetical protein